MNYQQLKDAAAGHYRLSGGVVGPIPNLPTATVFSGSSLTIDETLSAFLPGAVWSLSMWVKVNTYINSRYIFGLGTTANENNVLGIYTSPTQIGLYSNNVGTPPTTNRMFGTFGSAWTHLAVLCNFPNAKMVVNGVEVSDAALAHNATFNRVTLGAIRRLGAAKLPAEVTLSDVFIHDGLLTVPNVATLMAGPDSVTTYSERRFGRDFEAFRRAYVPG